ncbi:MAG: hypothetical protein ACI87E_000207 [Mariniblastus sp.]|jgi:hypothetical protein
MGIKDYFDERVGVNSAICFRYELIGFRFGSGCEKAGIRRVSSDPTRRKQEDAMSNLTAQVMTVVWFEIILSEN